MAEKNTLSILETIKKKMTKLDQKVEKGSKIASLDDEFEYISPALRKQSAEQKNQFEERKFIIKPMDGNIVEMNADLKASGSRLENPDFDIDDETKSKKGEEVGYTIEEDDIEDYEDEVDFAEEDVEETQTEEKESGLEVSSEDDEFDLDSLEEENEEENSKQEEEAEEEVSEEEASNETSEESSGSDDDFNFEELMNEANKEEKAEAEAAQENAQESPAQEAAPQEQPAATDVSTQAVEQVQQPSIEAQAVQAQVVVETPPQAEALEMQAASQDQTAQPSMIASEQPQVETAQPSTPSQPATLEKGLEQLDAELDKLDKELEKQKATDEKKKVEEKISMQEEIDKEFGKEIMGLKPQFTEEKSVAEKPKEENAPPKTLEEATDILFSDTKKTEEKIEEKLEEKTEEKLEEKIEEKTDIEENAATEDAPSNPLQWQVLEKMPSQKEQAAKVQNDVSRISKSAEFDSMIHDETVRQASDSIKRLIDAKNVVEGISTFSKSPAFSELALQIMEPKLEKWLNENLPHIVENIVRDEIKKIIPKE
jgi:cell pole-organizing protein PopZ